jgi:hypothetical protein
MNSTIPRRENGTDDDALIDDPRTYRLGVDADGREHWHHPLAGRVWVTRDGETVHTQDLEGSVVHWVTFIDEEHGGWQQRQPVEQTSGLSGIVDDVAAREAPR